MRHSATCDWIVEPLDDPPAFCPRCLLPVIREEMVPETAPAPASGAADREEPAVAPRGVMCPDCDRERTPNADGTCPWCGRLLVSGTDAADAATLTVTAPNGYRVEVTGAGMTLGRLSEDERFGDAVDSDGVSRRHAEIRVDGDGVVWLRDLGSTNGTWLAGRRLGAEARLAPGDSKVGLGRFVEVTIHVP